MTRRLILALVSVALVATAAACGGGSSGDGIAAPPPSVGTVVDFPVPARIANLPLTKADGTTTSLAAYRGKPVMIADYLTLCTDICPMITANVVALGRALAAQGYGHKVDLLEITVDPWRDSLPRMRAYQRLFGDAPVNWTLLRASRADTKTLWKYFGVAYRRVKDREPDSLDWWTHKPLTFDVQHTDAVLFLDAEGRERFIINASPDVQGHQPPKQLVRLLSKQGVDNLEHPNPVDSWTVSQGLSVFSWLTDHRFTKPA